MVEDIIMLYRYTKDTEEGGREWGLGWVDSIL